MPDERVAFDCEFWRCPFLATPAAGAFVLLAGCTSVLVCEFCRAKLERARPAGTSARVAVAPGASHLVFRMDHPEGRA